MIDLTQYRIRIATFSPRISSKGKFTLTQHTRFGKNNSSAAGKTFFQVCYRTLQLMFLITFLVHRSELSSDGDLVFNKSNSIHSHCYSQSNHWLLCHSLPIPSNWLLCHSLHLSTHWLLCHILQGLLATLPGPIDWNFLARYTYGNKRQHGLKIIHWNKGPSHLENKKSEIEAVVDKYHPHILGLSEANLHSWHDMDKVQLPDYTLYTCPTLSNPSLQVSRIVVYTHSSLVVKLRPDLMDNNISSIWMEIGLPGRGKILICNTYREWQHMGQQDNSSRTLAAQLGRWELFLQQWERAIREEKEVIVTGDINIDSFKWCRDDLPSTDSTYKLKPLIEALFERIIPQGFSQQVRAATHSWVGQNPSCIDHLYSNKPDKLAHVQGHINGGSDHKLIYAVRYSKSIKRNVRYIRKRCFKGFNEEKFKEEVKNLKWFDVYSESNVDTAVSLLTCKLTAVLDKYAPIKTIQVRPNYAPWINDNVKEAMRQRDTAQIVASMSQCPDNWREYKNIRNSATKVIKNAKKVWETEQLNYFGNSAKDLWRNVKSWMRWKNTGPPTQLFYKGELVTSPYGLASAMNSFFIQKVKELQKKIPPPNGNPLEYLQQAMSTRTCSLKFEQVHPEQVLKIVQSLKNSKATGLDDIDTSTLKLVIHDILPALTHIINLSLSSLTFPKAWKLAKIIPLLKKGDPLDPQNYRPVALLSVVSKVLERVIFKQIVNYIEENCLLHPCHHGSRDGHSTSTALLEMYDNWVEGLEKGKMTGVMMIDLSAAFDLVDHPLLLQKLELLGFDHHAVIWMWSYLTGRYQAVYVDGKISEFQPVQVGVPQGSVLGALLYVLFVNDLPEIVHGHEPVQGGQGGQQGLFNLYCAQCGGVCCYVDDSTYTFSSSNPAEITETLSSKYMKLADYMRNNRLVINNDKTHLVVMGGPRHKELRQQVSIDTGTVGVPPVETEKLLGINIHQSMRWKEHIIDSKKSMVKSLTSRLNALKMISVNATFKTRLMVANSCFMSIITYMIVVWGGTEKFIVRVVQVMQNKAARCVTKQGWYTPTRTLLLQCNWLSIEQLIVFHTALQVWRIKTNKGPHYLHGSFQPARTRSAAQGNLDIPVVQTSVASKSFMVRGPLVWNQIPPQIRNCKKLEIFKKELKEWIRVNIEIT